MKISFPHLGNYCVPIERLLKNLFPHAEILTPPPFTRKTIEAGTKHSPDFVCMPFKYNLGNFIEALEQGADTLFQGSGGCRYSYYLELQEQILKDLGYKFTLHGFFSESIGIAGIFKNVKAAGCKLDFARFAYYALLAIKTIELMDELDFIIRENIGFECEKGSFEKAQSAFLNELKDVTTFSALRKTGKTYNKIFREIKIDKPSDVMRVGLVGELYSLMEPFANFFIEKELAKNKIMVKRFTNATYLMFRKDRAQKKVMESCGGYLKYALGADGAESIAHLRELSQQGYDGIIHLKPFGCTPEVSAMPILMKAAEDCKMPVLYFSFDSQSSEVGIKTRLEAFYDMLEMKKIKSQISDGVKNGKTLFGS